MTSKIPCSVEILARNSARTLERCLESVKNFEEILVLDGNSTDNTREIAEKYGCRLVKQYETDEPNVVIKDYSEVRNKGLRLATYDWFMFIDSDEYLSPEAVEEIRSIVESPSPEAFIWWQPRRYVLGGKVIECATTYPNKQIRLFHSGHVDYFIKPIHEKIKLKKGEMTGILQNFEYVPLEDLSKLESRWKRYILAEAEMAQKKSYAKKIQLAARQLALFLFYAFRYVKNLLFCRGYRMPLTYEWSRHKYNLKLVLLLLKNTKP